MRRIADFLEWLVAAVVLTLAHAALPLMIILGAFRVLDHNLRWGIAAGFLELESFLFFALVVTSFAYGFARDAHVRIDLLFARLPARVATRLEIFAVIAIVTPLCGILVYYGAESAWRSLLQGETLGDTGLRLGWAPRAAVPLGFVLLELAALARLLRQASLLRGSRGMAAQ